MDESAGRGDLLKQNQASAKEEAFRPIRKSRVELSRVGLYNLSNSRSRHAKRI
jgi:hypothetical protein